MTGRRRRLCGNDPAARDQLTDADRQAVQDFMDYLRARRQQQDQADADTTREDATL